MDVLGFRVSGFRVWGVLGFEGHLREGCRIPSDRAWWFKVVWGVKVSNGPACQALEGKPRSVTKISTLRRKVGAWMGFRVCKRLPTLKLRLHRCGFKEGSSVAL